jgi:hypothetical protein
MYVCVCMYVYVYVLPDMGGEPALEYIFKFHNIYMCVCVFACCMYMSTYKDTHTYIHTHKVGRDAYAPA